MHNKNAAPLDPWDAIDRYQDLCTKHGVPIKRTRFNMPDFDGEEAEQLEEFDKAYEAYKKGVPTQSRLVDFVACGPITWEDIKQPPKYSAFLRYRIKPENDVAFNTAEPLVDRDESGQYDQWAKQETETWGENLHVPGAKDDASKPPVALVFESFPRALLEVAKVAGYGCKKYTRGGWKDVPDAITRYSDAGARHELYRHIEGEIDPESGLLHLAHQAWNVLAVLEKTLEKN